MRPQTIQPVSVKLVDERSLEARLQKVKSRIRQRAYEFYCKRGSKGCDIDDWKRAENECCAAPLAGMADEENDIRITAFVPGVNAADVAIDVLPNEIVIEADRNGEVERFKRFPLSVPIDPNHVEAHMRGCEIDVTARKTR